MKWNRIALAWISLLLLSLLFCGGQATAPADRAGEFDFVFMPDIHLQPELNAVAGFRRAIARVNRMQPDFVVTGGDLIMDALGQEYSRADRLYTLYLETARDFDMPVYSTIGNHEVWGWYDGSGADPAHPLYGKGMYEERIGKRYHSFDHENWHFMCLDSIQRAPNGRYRGGIDAAQMEWIRGDLSRVAPDTPIALFTHIPFVTVNPLLRGETARPVNPGIIITNGAEVLGLFADHELRLVLQGHLHVLEAIQARGILFITGGAVSAKWWEGPLDGMEEGFLHLRIAGEDIHWEYIDYGWEAKVEEEVN